MYRPQLEGDHPMNIRSYQGKVFVIESSDCIIREDDLITAQTYRQGEDIPPGRNVGDPKVIPQRTEINVTDVRADANRHVFVFARAANDNSMPSGWTKAMNLVGSFANETSGCPKATTRLAWTPELLSVAARRTSPQPKTRFLKNLS